ncbi:MAG: amidohydrolase family protein [Gemmatimonadota bacterium]
MRRRFAPAESPPYRRRMTALRSASTRLATALVCTLGLACVSPGDGPPTTAFTGATVWDGTGAAPVVDAVVVVQEGRIRSVTAGGEPPRGATVIDAAGSYIIPGLIDAHAHANSGWASDGVMDSEAQVRDGLALFARYGVTSVNSLGDDDAVLAVRDAGRADGGYARVAVSGPVITDTDPAAAASSARARADAGVDWLKLRVDNNLGATTRMPWDAVEAVLDVGRERGVPVATHLFYLEDAKRLLEMGTGMVAHSVRDAEVDEEFIEALRASGVCYVPTLTREVSTFVYGDRPDFFDDPFFAEGAHPGQLARVSDPDFVEQMARSPIAAAYRRALDTALANVKTLVDAGLPVAMGTDAGPNGRFPGYFEHLELWMMVDAGVTPEQALLSATSVAAECIGRDDIGTLEPGRWADFLVLAENPLDDIRATRSLEAVYIGGEQLVR